MQHTEDMSFAQSPILEAGHVVHQHQPAVTRIQRARSCLATQVPHSQHAEDTHFARSPIGKAGQAVHQHKPAVMRSRSAPVISQRRILSRSKRRARAQRRVQWARQAIAQQRFACSNQLRRSRPCSITDICIQRILEVGDRPRAYTSQSQCGICRNHPRSACDPDVKYKQRWATPSRPSAILRLRRQGGQRVALAASGNYARYAKCGHPEQCRCKLPRRWP